MPQSIQINLKIIQQQFGPKDIFSFSDIDLHLLKMRELKGARG